MPCTSKLRKIGVIIAQTTLPDYFRTINTHRLIHGITFYHRRTHQFTNIDVAGSRPWDRQRNFHHNRFG